MADGIPACAWGCVCEPVIDVVDAALGLGIAEGVCEMLLLTSDIMLSVAVADPVCRQMMEQDGMPTSGLHNMQNIPELEGRMEQ